MTTMTKALTSEDAKQLRDCVTGGGVAVFPSDTVYGICCDPENEQAAQRLYELKGRPATRPAAVMFFALEPALQALAELGEREQQALGALLPGPVTLLLENRAGRFAAACRRDPSTLGLRVPWLGENLHALASISEPVMQSSANLSGQPDASRLEDVPAGMRAGADVVLDGGELHGTPSTVIDLRDYEQSGTWYVLREGALSAEAVRELLQPGS
jgi:L-threonylcarbamoyladenylate synthase